MIARLLCLLWVFVPSVSAWAASCESLRHLKLQDTTITLASEVAPGAFVSPRATLAALFTNLPAFCRVTAQIKPTPDSDIRMEVWLPQSGWNRRFVTAGNGGFAGSIDTIALARAIAQGFATASTDTGHQASEAPDARWALGHPEKIVDFGWRAVHEMTLKAKDIIRAFYGVAPEHAYFSSCSNGGRQALMEAQRFPSDYDGILAGAPANYWTRLLTQAAWDMRATEADPASYIPASKIPALAAAVLKACDAADGVTDGIINDPRECRFDPAAIQCKAGDSDSCLTAPQVAALKKIYAGPRNAKGEIINPGFSPGGETGRGGWALWVAGRTPHDSLQYQFMTNFFANMVWNDPNWDFKSFNVDHDFNAAEEREGAALNATDPNLRAFRDRGGKLILYHGWSDAAIPPLDAIKYFESVRTFLGADATDSFARLYMVPAMQHCRGGAGPDSFGQFSLTPPDVDPQHNMFAALEQWVEKGVAPSSIIASHEGERKMTRPLCPYPQVAHYKGTGNMNDAANFTCSGTK